MKIVIFKWTAICLLVFALVSCKKDYNTAVKFDNGLYDLYIYDVAAKTNTRITNSPDTLESSYTFSSDSKKILFNANTSTYFMNIDGSGKTRFAILMSEPDYSIDGEKIAYTKDGDLFIVNSDGTNNHQLTHNIAGLWKPLWSKDGQKIACSSDNGLCIITLDGNVDNIIPQNSTTWYDWSNDSQKLAYSKFVSNYVQIFKYDLSDRTETKLTATYKYNYDAYWRPGKDEMVFSSSQSDTGGDLILMNADGKEQKIIIHKNLIGSPCWSPDGNQITFITDNSDLAIIDVTGENFRVINELPGACLQPKWSPDGKYILYYRAIFYD